MMPHFQPSGHPNLYLLIQNPTAFTTTLSTLHKHIAHLSEILNTATHIHRYTTTQTHTHDNQSIFLLPSQQFHLLDLGNVDNMMIPHNRLHRSKHHPTITTYTNTPILMLMIQEIWFMFLIEIRLGPRINFSKTHTATGFFPSYTPGQYSPFSVPYQLQLPIFTPSSHRVPPFRFHFFQAHTTITYVRTTHIQTLYFLHIWYSNAVTTFKTSPYSRQYHLQFHSATSPREEHISNLVRFLKTFFQYFSTQYGTQIDTVHRQILLYPLLPLVFIFTRKNKFFQFIINLRILSFSQVGFSLRFTQVFFFFFFFL